MARAKDIVVPLQTLIARKRGYIADNEFLAREVQPLPGPLVMEFFLAGTPKAKAAAWARINPRTGRMVRTIDKRTQELEREHRGHMLETIISTYPQFIPYLPVCLAFIHTECYHLMPPPDDPKEWWSGKEHVTIPDTENCSKMTKDAGGSREKNVHPVLYWDDCIITRNVEEKQYWDPSKLWIPHYPPQPGTVFVVRMNPLIPHPECYHCRFCFKPYRTEEGVEFHQTKCKRNPALLFR